VNQPLPPRPETAPPPPQQTTSAVLLVRPAAFACNRQTLSSNRFQRFPALGRGFATAARREFDTLLEALGARGILAHAFEGQTGASLPDEVFVNNWISFHADGTAVLYPMMAENRRAERRADLLASLSDELGYRLREVVDLTCHETHERFLEGTGSLVLDHINRCAYACLSARTHPVVLREFGERLRYEPFAFEAYDRDMHPIYHTNVMMSVGSGFAVLCSRAVRERRQRSALCERLDAGGREIIEIGFEELHAFAGNLLELRGADGPVIVLSERAWKALGRARRSRLQSHGELLAVDVGTIETLGGGSVRCMLAEVRLPRRT
jgi:hypothetical protein